MKKIFVLSCLAGLSVLIISIFWFQKLKYLLPTEIPENYKSINTYHPVLLTKNISKNKPVLLHFFNPDCPCSRFNLKHLRTLYKNFKGEVNFYVVIPEYSDVNKAKDLVDENIELIIDYNKKLALACGVYSTPQAAILTSTHLLYYRGNYNKSRYCIKKESSYAQIALTNLLENKAAPHFDQLATKSYGCSIKNISGN